MNLVVIGVGNPFRRDDGVGHVVAERVQEAEIDNVEVALLDGEPVRLIESWAGRAHVVLIDAMCSGAPPGTIRSISPDMPPSMSAPSSHASGVVDACLLGRAMNRMPDRLTIIAIEGVDFAFGTGLSPAVADAAAIVATQIIAMISSRSPRPVTGGPGPRALPLRS